MISNLVLFDNSSWDDLLPLTYTKPTCELRTGINTLREKWMRHATSVSWKTKDYLSEKYPITLTEDNIFIAGNIVPTPGILDAISELQLGQGIIVEDELIAFRSSDFTPEVITHTQSFTGEILSIKNPWDIFERNAELIAFDFEILTKGRSSEAISFTNNILAAENIFLEPGAKVEFATIDASTGPVYIGKDAEIMAGALIQGPLALCEHATIKMGAKIYGATTIGPWSKAGGEVQNSVLTAYSNKGHDGYLGNSVLGEWCNLGADTNNSNLKNNYAKVKLWNYASERFVNTGLQFCGLIMGDHSKCGINTMFNTGTVVGVSANIFGSGFPRNFIPSFSWGGAGGFSLYTLKKALETAEIVMARRKIQLTEVDGNIMGHIFNLSEKYRK
jgi:UDP-N-acetylglucosamine diphosphorylase/glucosamine-1-phosphate N-acetyltransferase